MAGKENATSVINAEQIDQELEILYRLKSRVTGSATHEQLISHIEHQLLECGLQVHSDTLAFDRWSAAEGEAACLTVAGRPHRISSVVPYSGITGPEGVEGELVWLGSWLPKWERARGKIAVVEVSNFRTPFSTLVGTWGSDPAWPSVANPVIAATIAGARLGHARKAGVRAVIFVWKNISEANAHDQYLPFTFGYQDVPAVFVTGIAGQSIVEAASSGETASLVLPHEITSGATTRTIWTMVEGTRASDETVLLVTHTDGVNAIEENGHIAMIAMARAAVANPPERTSVFIFTSGHLRIPAFTSHGQATQRFLNDHPELWNGKPGHRRAVAGLAIEHLGAREFIDHPATTLHRATGRLEPELLYATTPELADLARKDWREAPDSIFRISKPSPLIHFGEGEPLMHVGIPAVSLVTAPIYLLAEYAGDETELVDRKALHRQIDSFERLHRRLGSVRITSFGSVAKPGRIRKFASGCRVAAALAGMALIRLLR